MKISRRALLGTTAASLSMAHMPSVVAQTAWPVRPVRIVSPYGAGGASDISVRMLAEYLGSSLGQNVIVENRAGAGTRVANEYVARSAGDGYTVLYAAAPYATAEALHGKMGFDPKKDLLPVAMVALAPLFLIVNTDSNIKSASEFVAYAKSRPEGVNFGSPGAGSQPHLAAELLLRDAGAKGVIVHYRGDAPAYTELLAGRIDATLTAITAALPHIQNGKLRVLGVASAERSPLFPDAPTLKEQGLSSVLASGWYGFMVPAATPAPIRERLQAETKRILGTPEVQQKFLALGLEPRSGSAAEFGKFIDSETSKWSELIRTAGIKAD
ncbi:Bug family tripartite tricarboxylate transporter substrate binding protein [Hydrogenophaga sp.]|uniref:Bug family tripartite tricarboxylate transporter substrate binding protein n=1 Tax=Hydrogenophaga sp. TaxID=1904254 RepID=UPI0035616EDE